MLFLSILGVCLLFVYSLSQSFFLSFVPRKYRSKKEINGRKILITGAGNGLGRQLAIQFSKYQTSIILMDIDMPALEKTQNLMDRSSSVFSYMCDVSDRKMVNDIGGEIKKDVGDVDILINNSGILSGKYFLDLEDDEIIKTMEVNAIAHFWTCKAFLPAMMAKNSGHIVSIASIAGKTSAPRMVDYSASKFAAVGFAECLELELREKRFDGIKVTIVYPSYITTGLFNGFNLTIGSPMTPEYVAKEVVESILEEQETLYIPYYWKYLLLVGQLIPRWVRIWFYKNTGGIKCMKNFTGREKKLPS